MGSKCYRRAKPYVRDILSARSPERRAAEAREAGIGRMGAFRDGFHGEDAPELGCDSWSPVTVVRSQWSKPSDRIIGLLY